MPAWRLLLISWLVVDLEAGAAIAQSPPAEPRAPPLHAESRAVFETHVAAEAHAPGPHISVSGEALRTTPGTPLARAVAESYSDSLLAAAPLAAAALATSATGRTGPERLVDLALRSGPYGDLFGLKPDGLNLDKVIAADGGIDLGAPGLRHYHASYYAAFLFDPDGNRIGFAQDKGG